MKKLHSTIMMLAMMVAALGFTACGGDDDDDTPSIIGTWKIVKASISGSDEPIDISGGNFYMIITDKTITAKYSNTSSTDNYTLKGNMLRMSDIQFLITELTFSSMVWQQQDTKSSYTITYYMQRVTDDNTLTPSSDASGYSTSLVIVRSNGVRYTTKESLEWMGVDPNGNLTDNGSIFCWMVLENTQTPIYFRINLTNGEKSVRDFPVGYNLGNPTVNFGLVPGSDNKYKYGSGSLKVINNNGKGFTLKFDNYWVTRTSDSSIIINGTLYVEKERFF